MTSIYFFKDTNATYQSNKTGKKVHPYFRTTPYGTTVRTAFPRLFKRLSDVVQHLSSHSQSYAVISGLVLVRMDLDTGEKDYLVATAEKCVECKEVLHHAIGIEIWCNNQKCSKSPKLFGWQDNSIH